ncbi:hypothetical protein D3C81_1038990 [compost metagenome]
MLFIDIFELSEVVGCIERWCEVVTGACEVQTITTLRGRIPKQVDILPVRRLTRRDFPEAASVEGQLRPLLGFDGSAFIGSDQLPRVVGVGHRQRWSVLTDPDFRVRRLDLGRHTGAAVIMCLLALAVVVREYRVWAAAPTTV